MLLAMVPPVETTQAGYGDELIPRIDWKLENVTDVGRVQANRTAIDVDPMGGVHIAYMVRAEDGIVYAHRDPEQGWSTQVIVNGTAASDDFDLLVDPIGQVHLVYRDVEFLGLVHALRDLAGDWTYHAVDIGNWTGYFPDLGIDPEGDLHVVFVDKGASELVHGVYIGEGRWLSEPLVNGSHQWHAAAMDISDDGTVHVVYCANYSRVSGLILYGNWTLERGWLFEDKPFGSRAKYLQIRVWSSGDRDVLVQYQYDRIDLYHWDASRSDVGWKRSELTGTFEFVRNTVMELNSREVRLLVGQVYEGSRIYGLRYQITTEIGAVRHDRLGYGHHRGNRTSIAVGPNDAFHLAFFDFARGTLVYATNNGVPSEPVDLVAEAGEIYVNLSWDPPSDMGEEGSVTYNVYRTNSPYKVPRMVIEGWDGTEYQDFAVEQRFRYYYWVAANNSRGEGAIAGPVGAVTPTRFPTEPLNLTAEAGDDYVNLTWNPPSDTGGREITGYIIVWGTGRSGMSWGPEYYTPYTTKENITRPGTVTWFNHTDREMGVTLRYSVVPEWRGGLGEPSPYVSATPMMVPGPPTNLSFERSIGLIKVNWTRPAFDGMCRIQAYNVYRGTSPIYMELLTTLKGDPPDWGLWSEPVLSIHDDGNLYKEIYRDRYSDPDLEPTIGDGVAYYYSVAAVNPSGEGERSQVIWVPAVGTPGPPRDVAVERRPYGAEVTWKSPLEDSFTEVVEYIIFRRSKGGDLELVGRVSGYEKSFEDSDINTDIDNWYVIRAENVMGIGESSEEVFLEGLDKEAPPIIDRIPGGVSTLGWALVSILTAIVVFGVATAYIRRRHPRGPD
jgi:hypothetical protein